MNKLITTALLSLAAFAAQAEAVDGEVRKIDRAAGKITLKHADIKSLDMPAMTMVFRVSDPKLLEGLAEGAKVSFEAQKVDGQYTVIRIAPK